MMKITYTLKCAAHQLRVLTFEIVVVVEAVEEVSTQNCRLRTSFDNFYILSTTISRVRKGATDEIYWNRK